MSEARELYTRACAEYPLWEAGNPEAVKRFSEVAAAWRGERRFFSAAVCMIQAVWRAWGTAELDSCFQQALADLRASVDTEPPDSFEGLAALQQWLQQLMHLDPRAISRLRTLLQQEMAQRLLTSFSDSKDCESYLVKGFVLRTDMDGDWTASFPDPDSATLAVSETICGATLTMSMSSAFHLLLQVGDYAGAQSIVKSCPEAFATPGLKGWALAVDGFLTPEKQEEFFAGAAEAFAQDVVPPMEELQKGKHWTSANVDLWAKYFRARALVARVLNEPNHVHQLLQQASQTLIGTESGWVDSQVNRFRLLISTLLDVLEKAEVDAERILKRLQGDQWLHVTSHDPIIEEFVRSAAQALQAFRYDPGRAVIEGRLSSTLELLGRIPLVGPSVTNAIGPAIVESALFGPQKTWIYRTLEAITDEAHLRKLILRLEQAHLPLYAQVRHGPLEYGKDVVAVLEKDGRRMLRMWQAKIGDMTVPTFRDARQELEDMYLVPLPTLQISGEIAEREGILVFNGHPNANVEPVMQGWLNEQTKMGRKFKFMHLDDLVNWIVDNRLTTELRKVLAELKIDPII